MCYKRNGCQVHNDIGPDFPKGLFDLGAMQQVDDASRWRIRILPMTKTTYLMACRYEKIRQEAAGEAAYPGDQDFRHEC
ncbi:hypothetical protein BLA18110_05013 [Burkholderia lata]|nr:hypothetical protein BLA18110_05013 [Burkholderia lata]